MQPEDAGEGVTVPSQVGDDALGIVPVDEYETVFSFPTVGKDSELCATRCHGFWLTFYVDDTRSVSGQGPRANKTKYARSMRAFKVRASKRDPPKFFVSTPPAGLFSHRDIVWQCDVQWPYEKSASNWLHAVIPAERLLIRFARRPRPKRCIRLVQTPCDKTDTYFCYSRNNSDDTAPPAKTSSSTRPRRKSA